LAQGQRLLSDDISILETVALLTARRIDAVRVNHDRCVMDLRTQEMSKLATEAELRALRAQLNPHFLFNALTTIGYLIQTEPERALETLMRLTGLLRSVLRRSAGEFTTLVEEVELIKTYLEIEKARFEERLQVEIEIPELLHNVKIPTLLIQPLVENAIKHGITPSRMGGEIFIKAEAVTIDNGSESIQQELVFLVRDTGVGVSEAGLSAGRAHGLGLASIEHRLKCHYSDRATLKINSGVGVGTLVEIHLPIDHSLLVMDENGSTNTTKVKRTWKQNYVS
jgi:two-component system LytT family sensor kinase